MSVDCDSNEAQGAPAVTTDVIAATAELRRCDADWLRLCRHPESHPALFEAVCRVNAQMTRPHVVFVRRGGNAVAMAVGRIQRERVPIKFGLATLGAPNLRVLRLSYDAFAGDLSDDVFAQLRDALVAPLTAGEADAIFFDKIPQAGAAHAWASGSKRRSVLTSGADFMRDFAPARDAAHWTSPLPQTFEAFCASLSRAERHNYRNTRNKLEREFGDRLSIACYTSAADFARVDAETRAVAAKTYQSAFAASYAEQFWAGPLFSAALERGMARCYIASIDGVPCAFWHGLVWRGIFHSCFTGYDQAFSAFSLGRAIFYHGIADLCRTGAASTLDFGVGHAEYKRRLGSEHWLEADRYLFAKRLRPITINLVRGGAGRLEQLSDAVLSRLGIRARLKTVWHRRITNRTGANTQKPAA